jgi:hypothetical protein
MASKDADSAEECDLTFMADIEMDGSSKSSSPGDTGGQAPVGDFRFRGCCHPPGTDEKNGFLLTADEMRVAFKRMPGMIILDNHDHSKPVGRVETAYLKDGMLMITGSFNPDERGEKAMRRVRKGRYRGLSLGCKHAYDPIERKVISTMIEEVSVCDEGQIPGTTVTTIASRNRFSGTEDASTQRTPVITMVSNERVALVQPAKETQRNASGTFLVLHFCHPYTHDHAFFRAPIITTTTTRKTILVLVINGTSASIKRRGVVIKSLFSAQKEGKRAAVTRG